MTVAAIKPARTAMSVFACAALGAKESWPEFQTRAYGKEVVAAEMADPLSCPPGARVAVLGTSNNEKLALLDCCARVRPVRIATLTRSHQVLRKVVAPHAIQVIGDQSISPAAELSGDPEQRRATPVAWMWARADFLVQNESMGLDPTCLISKRVPWMAYGAVSVRRLVCSSYSRVGPALYGAVRVLGFYLRGIAEKVARTRRAFVKHLLTHRLNIAVNLVVT